MGIKLDIKDGMYMTLEEVRYKNIVVPKGFVFDGVTVKRLFRFMFSNKDLIKGLKASCIHDYMCRHKKLYGRKTATKYLVDIWVADGLSLFKANIVSFCVNFYQFFKKWN
ncbi:MAG: hypothetical protein BWY74_03216 [Firmicutes bacterium ADurb.Bin419]|nr:MAG: hypothetical protein BWY74_03216 [Firmicutes bacterium ADurb.Bin419]